MGINKHKKIHKKLSKEEIEESNRITAREMNKHLKLYGLERKRIVPEKRRDTLLKSLRVNHKISPDKWYVVASMTIEPATYSKYSAWKKEDKNISDYLKYYTKRITNLNNKINTDAIKFDFRNKEIKTEYSAPKFYFEQKIIINKRKHILNRDLYVQNAAWRIRNYLAFVFNEIMPLEVAVIGHSMYSYRFGSPDFNTFPSDLELGKQSPKEVQNFMINKFKIVLKLIKKIKLDSLQDRLINMYGYALWSEEPINSFLYKWLIIEAISNDTVSKFTENDFRLYYKKILKKKLPQHFKEIFKKIHLKNFHDLLKFIKIYGRKSIIKNIIRSMVQSQYFNTKDKIEATIRKLRLNIDRTYLPFDYKLRNEIVHGDINIMTFQKAYGVERGKMFAESACYKLLKTKLQKSKSLQSLIS